VESAILATLVESQAGGALVDGPGPEGGAAALRRAEEFVRARLQHPLSTGDIARAAGLSARTLFRGFARVHGCSPMDYVRRLRLDRARRELLAAGERASVTDVALSWGFAHLGRFAGYYRAAFGEAPSQTLGRRRITSRAR
jgi:transcriptional regulator GlxA family with amidase domain